MVIGPRNWSTASSWRASSSKLNHNDKGSLRSHSGGMNRARAAFQKELRTNYPATIGANASTCASRSAMFPGSDGPRPGFKP